MRNLELILDTEIFSVKIGQGIAETMAAFNKLAPVRDPDPEMNRDYLLFEPQGFELSFSDGHLGAIFLYTDRQEATVLNTYQPASPSFTGILKGLLPDDFFMCPSKQKFCESLEAQGFERGKKNYPNSIDYLAQDIRIRYESRSDCTKIYIDNGNRIRG